MEKINFFKTKPNIGKRLMANIIDYVFYFVCVWGYFYAFGDDNGDGGKKITGLAALLPVILWIVYFIVVEAVLKGTVGHKIMNLKVLTVDRKEIGAGEAILRHILDFFELATLGIIAIISITSTEKNQRVGDLLAKTIVIDMSDPLQYRESKGSLPLEIPKDEELIS